MAMGITFLNGTTFSTMTLAQVARESKSTTESILATMEEGGMGCLQKVKNKERNETKRHVWTSYNPWQCKVRRCPNLFCSQ